LFLTECGGRSGDNIIDRMVNGVAGGGGKWEHAPRGAGLESASAHF